MGEETDDEFKTFPCNICHEVYWTAHELQTHHAGVHGVRQRRKRRKKDSPTHYKGATPEEHADSASSDDQRGPRCKQSLNSSSSMQETQPGQLW